VKRRITQFGSLPVIQTATRLVLTDVPTCKPGPY
jgi:hypothetical protein